MQAALKEVAEADEAVLSEAQGKAAELIAEAEKKAEEIVAEAEAFKAAVDAATAAEKAVSDAALAEANVEVEAMLARAREEADRIETDAAAILREAVESRDVASFESEDSEAKERWINELEAREAEVLRRERAVSDREHAAERAAVVAASQGGVPLYVVPDTGTGTDGWPQTADVSEPDSIDAIRREALAALEQARGDEVMARVSVPAAEANGGPIDYSPSVPHHTEVDIVDEDDLEKPAATESRYARHSAKLPRIGIDPSTTSSSFANLRKQMTSDD